MMNTTTKAQALAIVNFLVLALFPIEGNQIPNTLLHQNATRVSPWLKKVVKNQRPFGCLGRPWMCNKGGFLPPKSMLCCRNRCVNVTSDKNNCGFCGIRCPFNWQCCRGLCRDINVSLNCGRCGHRCPFGQPCFLGMCGYAQEDSLNADRHQIQKAPELPHQTQFGHSSNSHQSLVSEKEEF